MFNNRAFFFFVLSAGFGVGLVFPLVGWITYCVNAEVLLLNYFRCKGGNPLLLFLVLMFFSMCVLITAPERLRAETLG